MDATSFRCLPSVVLKYRDDELQELHFSCAARAHAGAFQETVQGKSQIAPRSRSISRIRLAGRDRHQADARPLPGNGNLCNFANTRAPPGCTCKIQNGALSHGVIRWAGDNSPCALTLRSGPTANPSCGFAPTDVARQSKPYVLVA
ncbi:unnamed protein product, partial [Iphiclides podalirius]